MEVGPALQLSKAAELVPVQKVTMPNDTSYGLEKWRHGNLISVDKSQAESATFILSQANGARSTFKFSLPNATRVWVHDFDLDAKNTIVFCGQGYSSEGQLAPFLAVKEANSESATVIRTYPYRAWAISVATDGSIWTVGLESAVSDPSQRVVNKSGDELRHFDRTGKLIASGVPYTDLGQAWSGEDSILSATNSKIGWYGPTSWRPSHSTDAMKPAYIEISSDLRSRTIYPGIPPMAGAGQALALVLTESGDAFLTWDDLAGGRATYHLDRSLRQWVKVPVGQADPNVIPVLKGEDQGVLVFREANSLSFLQWMNN